MTRMTLHEAIIQVLTELPKQTGTFQQVADLINDRKLYQRRDGKPLPSYQVKMRAFLASGKYSHLFKKVGEDSLKLSGSKL